MKSLKHFALATLVGGTLAVAGCSNSSNSSGSATGETVSGTAEAPGGAVALLTPRSVLEIAADFVISPAMADIIGLKPVKGAKVELIRVDNDGNQVGDVLATTTTSITGDYTLTLPAGVSLAGNLVVRISGRGGVEMRAQVVDDDVDITPVSEFVLQKFIANGADLADLAVNDVVKLKGAVESFDLTAGADLSDMLAQLDAEVGDFVDNTVQATLAPTGNAAAIAGNYRSSAFDFDLHDGDGDGYGTIGAEIYQSVFRFNDLGNGVVEFDRSREEGVTVMVTGSEGGASFFDEVFLETERDRFPASYSSADNGGITVLGSFEEQIDIYDAVGKCCGWRFFPSTYRLQKVKGRGLFFILAEEAGVRYKLIDTDDDGNLDAVNPNARAGDELSRAIEVFARQPSGMTAADLSGTFGRVWMGITLGTAGPSIGLETETNTIAFGGDGSYDAGPVANRSTLDRSGYGEGSDIAASGTVTVTADGDVTHIDGNAVDGFINDAYDFIALASGEGVDGGLTDTTWMIKLGAGTPTVTGNRYRVQLLAVSLSGNEMALVNTRFASTLQMTSESVGTLTGRTSLVEKADLGADILVTNEDDLEFGATASIGSQGAASIVINDGEGTQTLQGFFNADATLGIFRTEYKPTGLNPDALGLAVLVKIN